VETRRHSLYSVWRPALAVGESSTGNPAAKVVEPARSGCHLPPRTKLRKRDMPNVANSVVLGNCHWTFRRTIRSCVRLSRLSLRKGEGG
jgi:hypothetical protein